MEKREQLLINPFLSLLYNCTHAWCVLLLYRYILLYIIQAPRYTTQMLFQEVQTKLFMWARVCELPVNYKKPYVYSSVVGSCIQREVNFWIFRNKYKNNSRCIKYFICIKLGRYIKHITTRAGRLGVRRTVVLYCIV